MTWIYLTRKREDFFDFRYLNKEGRPTGKAVGVNTMGSYPQIIADYLGLAGKFTGHAFRRSSATIMADAGANGQQLKRLGRWKSSSVADSYVDGSRHSKIEISKMINGMVVDNGSSSSSGRPSFEGVESVKNNQFSNCTITFNFHSS